jgi:hypothetical protein
MSDDDIGSSSSGDESGQQDDELVSGEEDEDEADLDTGEQGDEDEDGEGAEDEVDQEEEGDDDSSVSSACPSETDRSKLLEIVVKRVGKGESDVLSLHVDPNASVLDLKTQISQELASKDNDETVPVDRQRLVYFGRMLRDNEEVLGSDSIKMKLEVTNYVHLSPLPEGAKPSPRSTSASRESSRQQHYSSLRSAAAAGNHLNSASFSFSTRPSSASSSAAADLREIDLLSAAARESHQESMERARRLGVLSRERRRRRQDRPYGNETGAVHASSPPSTGSVAGAGTSFAPPAAPTATGQHYQRGAYGHLEEGLTAVPLSGVSAVGTRLHHHHPSGLFPFTSASVRRAYLNGPSLLSTLTLPTTSGTTAQSSNSHLAQLSHLASTVASVSAEAQAVRSIHDSHRYMLQQAQGLSFELAPFLSVLEDRLRQAGNDGNFSGLASSTRGLVNHDARDTIHLLDHVSREASTLALLLRRMPPDAMASTSAGLGRTLSPPAAPSTGSSSMAGSIALERVSSMDSTILIPQGPSIFLPSSAPSWYPAMM